MAQQNPIGTPISSFGQQLLNIASLSDLKALLGSGVLFSSANLASVQTVGTNQVVYSVTIPASTVKPGGYLDFSLLWSGVSTGSKTVTVTLGGVTVATQTLSTTNNCGWYKFIWNRANTTLVTYSSAVNIPYTNATAAFLTSTLNWTVDQTFQVLGTVTVAAQGINIQSFTLKVVNP
jgi:hypothetical protein